MNVVHTLCLRRLVEILAVLVLSGITGLVHSSTTVLVASTNVDSPAIASIFRGVVSKDEYSQLLVPQNIDHTIEELISRGDSIIILGKSLIAQITPSESSSRLVGGGFYGTAFNPGGILSLSLEPSLETVVSEIRKTGHRVSGLRSVVSSQDGVFNNKLYATSATELGVDLSADVVTNERDAARAWFSLLQDIDPSTEAILITDDKYLESSGAYRHIIEAAWRRNILVVSTLPKYSRKGVSIGFVPDLVAYGQSLYDLLLYANTNGSVSVYKELLADASLLKRVFNRRTLVHIGLRLPEDIDRLNDVDLIIE